MSTRRTAGWTGSSPAGDPVEHHGRLGPGQERAQAQVAAAAEGHVRVRGTADVQPLRLVEHGRVVVGAAEQEHQDPAGADLVLAHHDRLVHQPGGTLDRRVVAQELLHRGRYQRRVGAQPGELVGVPQQRRRAGGDQVHGGLEAGEEREHRVVHDLVEAQPVRAVLRREQVRQQVVAGVRAALRQQRAEVPAQPVHRLVGRAPGLLRHDRAERPPQRQGVPAHVVAGLRRDAHQPRDDQYRQRVRQLADQVVRGAVQGRCQQLAHQLLDVPADAPDHGRGERLAHQAAQPRVLGRVAVQHDPGEERGGRPGTDRQLVVLLGELAAQPGIALQREHVGVPGHAEAARAEPAQRPGPAQPLVLGVRVEQDRRVQGVEAGRLAGRMHTRQSRVYEPSRQECPSVCPAGRRGVQPVVRPGRYVPKLQMCPSRSLTA